MTDTMGELIVLYDSACTFCVRCRAALEARRQYTTLRFLCCRSDEARARFGAIPNLVSELVVVGPQGRYWVGPSAFLICFWALAGGRALSRLLATELLWPITRTLFRLISEHRGALEGVFGRTCEGQHCAVAPSRAPYR